VSVHRHRGDPIAGWRGAAPPRDTLSSHVALRGPRDSSPDQRMSRRALALLVLSLLVTATTVRLPRYVAPRRRKAPPFARVILSSWWKAPSDDLATSSCECAGGGVVAVCGSRTAGR